MRNVLRGALLAGFAVLSTAASPPAAACTCVYAGAPCEAAWDSPLVFAGTVKAITARRVTFTVTEAFRGPDTPEIDLIVGNTSCDYWFEAGMAYLVYANNALNGPGWTTGSCTRTGKLSERQEDLAYLRLPEAEKGVSRIIGRVMHDGTPLPGVRVRAIGEQQSETTTGTDGTYAIYVWPLRSYEIVFDNPAGIVIHGGRETTVPAYRACRTVNGYARYDGRIAGRVTDATGKPVPHFPLRLEAPPRTARMSGRKLQTLTGADGTFEFDEVQPGSFRVVAHAAAADMPPLTPALFSVGSSARVTTGTLQLPSRLSPASIEISVVDADGRAVPDVTIRITRPGVEETPFGLRTDQRGRFAMSVAADASYSILAHRSRYDARGYITERASATVKPGGAPVTLRLRPER